MLRQLGQWLRGDMAPGEHPGWPEATPRVRLANGATLRLRPLHRSDEDAWQDMRLADEQWLRPVETTASGTWEEAHSQAAWDYSFRNLTSMARAGVLIPLVIELGGYFAGQLTLGNIQRGAIRECWVGYWVYSGFQGAGVATAACALGVDHAFTRVGMHRVTATYLPDNVASRRVLEKNGFVHEGVLRRNLHIDGEWRDHHQVALLVDDYSTSAVDRLGLERL